MILNTPMRSEGYSILCVCHSLCLSKLKFQHQRSVNDTYAEVFWLVDFASFK